MKARLSKLFIEMLDEGSINSFILHRALKKGLEVKITHKGKIYKIKEVKRKNRYS